MVVKLLIVCGKAYKQNYPAHGCLLDSYPCSEAAQRQLCPNAGVPTGATINPSKLSIFLLVSKTPLRPSQPERVCGRRRAKWEPKMSPCL
ncbi:hypothetical protein AVEN_164545-1 [Araneus ventricosus]|uniref:Uncharacterized protein n=1 Tax=Araneus ventricosus TaxID=182803 RepID=A0A4Y2B215_ARAVE|nr:hypothetical protein AVEN_164545-1 [Araneus ventricosus]